MKNKKYYLYFIRCIGNKLYTGISDDPSGRFVRHKKGVGARFTRQNKPDKIVYIEEFDNYLDAHRRELQIKKWRKEKKENLIKYRDPKGKK